MRRSICWSALVFFAVALSFAGAQAQRQRVLPPDLVVTSIDFQKVQSGIDAQGKTYWIFNVTATVKNQGRGKAGAFKVLLERNIGAGGAYQPACPGTNCIIEVPGLEGGHETTTRSITFNNAMGIPSKFKFTADSAGQVDESNEGNNSREEAFISLTIGEVRGVGGIVPLPKPDLFAVSVSFQLVSQAVVNGKTILTYKAVGKVKNLGPGSAPATELQFDRGAEWQVTVPFTTKSVPALAANAEALVYTNDIQHEVGTPGKYYNIIVDPAHAIDEVNEENNNLSLSALKAAFFPPNEPDGRPRPAVPRPRLR